MDKAKLVCEDSEKITLEVLDTPLSVHCATSEAGFAKIKTEEVPVETDGINDQHSGVLNAFAGNILHGTPLVADGTEGINGLMISNAAHLSSWTNETVSLPVDPDVYYAKLMEKVANSKAKKEVKETVNEDMSSTY